MIMHSLIYFIASGSHLGILHCHSLKNRKFEDTSTISTEKGQSKLKLIIRGNRNYVTIFINPAECQILLLKCWFEAAAGETS